MATTLSEITFDPLSDAIGAEVKGVDLSNPLSADDVAVLQQGWNDHLVLVFRDQDVSNDDQVRFCSYFGDLELVRTGKYASEDMKHTMMITNVRDTGLKTALEDGDMWFHSDQCYYEVPAKGSVLYAMEIPPVGGNTLFANCYLALETLPQDLQDRLAPLKAHHIYDYNGSPMKRSEDVSPDAPQYSHPVVVTHPETGRKALYVNRLMTEYIEEMPREESAVLLEQLFAHGEDTRFVYEHEWRVGDLVIWDNRCSMHARTDFDPAERRMLRRITIKGDPVR